jgi:hypothetical protein
MPLHVSCSHGQAWWVSAVRWQMAVERHVASSDEVEVCAVGVAFEKDPCTGVERPPLDG